MGSERTPQDIGTRVSAASRSRSLVDAQSHAALSLVERLLHQQVGEVSRRHHSESVGELMAEHGQSPGRVGVDDARTSEEDP